MDHSDTINASRSRPHDDFSAAGIQSGLRTRLFGRTDLYFYDETGSTNDQAMVLAERHCPEGTVVIADCQSRGRGQKEREWHSPRGTGIYLSLVLRPDIPPQEALKITLLSAVAVAETLIQLTALDVRIKWPNDIIINGKKISGILSEVKTGKNSVNYVVVGVGINVTTREEMFPETIRNIATSVLIESGKEVSRAKIICSFLEMFELSYTAFLNGVCDGILARWKELARIMGKRIRVEVDNNAVSGIVQYIDTNGFLFLMDDNGDIRRICSGDVCFC
ncbi:MAG TPA: biotin--[acetyl-CoA-carboxylase] ligase [Spirochaetota bacterium]|nr:biotin--[acetyl-CoA-carboxylase] ligase [Spirochaetota bacterium]